MSAFGNFGATNSGTGASTTSLFGAKPATAGGGLFGAPPGGAPATTGGTLGNFGATTPAASAGPSTQTGLFGGAGTIPTASSNIFGSKSPAPALAPSMGATPSGGQAGATPLSGLFGAPSTTTPAPTTTGTASANPLFGGLPKPADASAAKPSGAGLFGQTTSSAGAPSTLGATGGLFSQPAKPDATSASTTTPSTAAPNPLFGGSLFGAKTGTTPAATVSPTPTPTTSSTPAPPNFFANTVTKPAEQQKDGPATATTTTSTSSILGGGLFGAKSPADAAATTTASGGLFGKPAEKKDGSLLPAAATSTSTTTPAAGVTTLTNVSVAVAPPSTLKGKTLEEIVNKWTTDLETHVKEFNKFATEVAVWDRALIENSNTLAALYSHVEAAEKEQADIDQSLDHIEAQQNELAGVLTTYEKMSQDILGSQAGGMRALDTGPADTERDKNYMLATDLHTHLDDLSDSLTQMIDSVNALSLPSIDSAPTEDPMSQIAQILSSHLESLQWIDGAVRDVEGKIVEVEQRVKDNGHTMPSSNQKTSRAFGSNR